MIFLRYQRNCLSRWIITSHRLVKFQVILKKTSVCLHTNLALQWIMQVQTKYELAHFRDNELLRHWFYPKPKSLRFHVYVYIIKEVLLNIFLVILFSGNTSYQDASMMSSDIRRDIELDDEIKRCKTSLLQSQESNKKCHRAHENALRVMTNQDTKITDMFKAARERWAKKSSKLKWIVYYR